MASVYNCHKFKAKYMPFGGLLAFYGHGWSLIFLRRGKINFSFSFLPRNQPILHLSTGINLAEDLHGKPLFLVWPFLYIYISHLQNLLLPRGMDTNNLGQYIQENWLLQRTSVG